MGSYSGTPMSATTYVTTGQKFGSGALSVVSNGFVYLPTALNVDVSKSATTWECWFNAAAKPTALNVIIGSIAQGYIGVNSSGFPVFNIMSSANTTVTGDVNICDGEWHHLALVLTPTSVTGYIDGQPSGAATVGKSSSPANANITIGSLTWTGSSAATYACVGALIDEVAIWSGVQKYTDAFTPESAAYTGSEGMTALYHLDGDAADSAVAPVTAPGAPGVSLTAGNGQVVVSVTAPSNNGGAAITGYPIYAGTTSGQANQTLLTTLTAAGSYTITGLTNGTVEYVNVGATNSVGTTYSAEVSASPAAGGTTITANNSGFVYSPENWSVTTAGAVTINSGAYFRTLFTGGSVTLNFDISNNGDPISQIYYRINGYEAQTPWTRVDVASSVVCTMPSDMTDAPYALLEVVVKSTSETLARWADSKTAVVFTSVSLATGATISPPPKRDRVVLFFGDSITEGVRTVNQTATNDTDRNDAHMTWTRAAGEALGSEYANIGFGGSGLTVSGSGGVPIFNQSFGSIMSGVQRTFDSAPDLVVVNLGTNDKSVAAATFQAAAETALNSLLGALPSKTKIAVLRPFGGYQDAAWQAAVSAVGSSRISYIDTTGFLNAAYGMDTLGLHPRGPNSYGVVGPQVSNALSKLLSTSRSFVYRAGA